MHPPAMILGATICALTAWSTSCRAGDSTLGELERIDAEIMQRRTAIATIVSQLAPSAVVPRPMPYPTTGDAPVLGTASGLPLLAADRPSVVSAELVSEIADLLHRRCETLAQLATENAANRIDAPPTEAATLAPPPLEPRVAQVAALWLMTALLVAAALLVRRRAANLPLRPMSDAELRRAAGGAVRRLVA